MNILITFLTAKLNIFGGVEKSIFSLIDGLEKTGNNVFVYTSKNDDKLKNFYYSNYLNCNFDLHCLEKYFVLVVIEHFVGHLDHLYFEQMMQLHFDQFQQFEQKQDNHFVYLK